MSLARGERIGAGELEYLLGIRFVAAIAQVGKRLPEKRVQLQRPTISLGGHVVAFGLRAHFGDQLQSEAGNLAEVAAYAVEVTGLGEVVIDKGGLDASESAWKISRVLASIRT